MVLFADFISGACVGIEFFFGEDAAPEDKFAFAISLGIVRFTFVFPK